MDTGRIILQQGWDTHSALESYSSIHEPEFRVGGAYGGRGFPGARGLFHRELLLEREGQHGGTPPVLGLWSTARRRNVEEELAIIHGAQRREKVCYIDNYREFDGYREIDNFNDVDGLREMDNTRAIGRFRDFQGYNDIDKFRDVDGFEDSGYDRIRRFPNRDRDSFEGDELDSRCRVLHDSREGSRDWDFDQTRHGHYDSDHERGRRDRDCRRSRAKDRERRGKSGDRDWSPERDRCRERSRSRSHDDRARKSHSPRRHSRGKREDSQDEARHESRNEKNERKRDRDEKRHQERTPVVPSATLVVKGLSPKTVEDDLYQALSDWGPLRHVRVIKERSTGISRGFAFIDFPSVEAAQKMMDGIGEKGLVVDGRRLFFEYSSKPTGGLGAPQAVPAGSARGSAAGASKNVSPAAAVDWTCTVCGCMNFARRTLCFQCNEGRAEDAPPADVSSVVPAPMGKKSLEAGPTHVLVVRGLDEHVNEDTLHYEFSKYAPIKDLRLVRDKFTHVSRGFAFIHFHSVEDATKALDSSNGTTLEKNGQILRVAYAKSIHGPGSSSAATSQTNSLAAAAIEAATFAQQYNTAGWAPKEYNPDQGTGGNQQDTAPQYGFVWDEASGYYYDASSGFYYDGHRGLYYDGNHGIWYSYDQDTQQYLPYMDHENPSGMDNTAENLKGDKGSDDGVNVRQGTEKSTDANSHSKAVISAPPATIHTNHETTEKKPNLPEAVQAAAIAAQAASKKEKEKMKEKEKELRLASKGILLANKKKISNVVTMWKQRQNEGPVSTVVVDERSSVATTSDDRHSLPVNTSNVAVSKKLEGIIRSKDSQGPGVTSLAENPFGGDYHPNESIFKVRQVSNAVGNILTGMGRGTGRSLGRGDAVTSDQQPDTESGVPLPPLKIDELVTHAKIDASTTPLKADASALPFRTDASALGSYGPMAGSRRRFTESPQATYRDRAAERRSLYGSSLSGNSGVDFDMKDKGREMPFPPGVGGRGRGVDMPFPPGVGAKGSVIVGPEVQAYEVITSEKAIDERNVGNRMLRNMGWQEGSGLGKDGTGIVEPVQAQAMEDKAGLGSQAQHRKLDARFETQPGDSYRVVIQKKALARFHEAL